MTAPRIGAAIDVGGTFTDLVCFDPDEPEPRVVKVDSTPPEFERGALAALGQAGVAPGALGLLVHGTTVVINALTERRGAVVGLITTAGFRDTLALARGNRPDFFNLAFRKPAPFVPRARCLELAGRMSYRGEELEPLRLEELPALVRAFEAQGVEAVAVCFLHAYANPEHEARTLQALAELRPDLPAVASHQITREWREYERTSTTVLSAYVQPVAERYLRRFAARLAADGFPGQPYITRSNGGVDTLEAVCRVPITMVESGPAAGFWGAARLGRLVGDPDVIALDIGGTTAKCSLIQGGEVRVASDYWIERSKLSPGYPVMVPVVDLVEIGSGGGSVAWVDEFGRLHVGPRSAGAVPGPAAYGRGGREPTTTDAHLWLGRIDPQYLCGGTIEADMAATEAALARVAAPLGLDVDAAARGIVRIANHDMVKALELVSVNRGFDPRDFTLVAFGGAGALHAGELARELGMRKVVVPACASVFSAWSMLTGQLRRDLFATGLVALRPGCAGVMEALLAETEARAAAQFAAEGRASGTVEYRRYAKLRYRNQDHAIEVRLGPGPLGEPALPGLLAAFGEHYQREYGYRLEGEVEMVGVHVVATAATGHPEPAARALGPADPAPALKGERVVDLGSGPPVRAAVYDRARLAPGMTLSGPALAEDPGTTLIVHPGDRARVDGHGHLHVTIGAAAPGGRR